MGAMDIGEEDFPVAVKSSDAIKSFGQVVLQIQGEDGSEKMYCLPPMRATWLIAQLQAAVRLPN